MDTRAKSRWIITSTLIIGMLLGAVMSGFVTRDLFTKRRTSGGYFERLEEKIAPDASQKVVVKEILDKHKNQMDKIISRFYADMHGAKDALRKDLEPVLKPHQVEEVQNFLEKNKRYKKGKKYKKDKSNETGQK